MKSRACFLAAANKEAGAWLNALPVSTVGLRMDDDTVRLAVGLCLGTPLCQPHHCTPMASVADGVRDVIPNTVSALNDIIIHWSLSQPTFCLVWNLPESTVQMGSILMESLWCPGGGERSWFDAMCPDTFAPSYQ